MTQKSKKDPTYNERRARYAKKNKGAGIITLQIKIVARDRGQFLKAAAISRSIPEVVRAKPLEFTLL